MKKLLVICGPTATGKTSLALKLAKKFNGELISADSRQVYKDLDIGTGKDLESSSKLKFKSSKLTGNKIGYYSIQGIKLWGYDLVNPKEEFSVSNYIKIASSLIKEISDQGKLPILVGGTGLYIRGVVDGIGTSDVPKNENLRFELEQKDAEELFEILSDLNEKRAMAMNRSDRQNPRRLVRAIEIEKWKVNEGNIESYKAESHDTLMIGLRAPKEYLSEKIINRVEERVKQGIEAEIRKLLNSGVNWDMQSMNTLGYKEWKGYFEGTVSKEKVIERWIADEIKYAKRQITWFKKDLRINWFDITSEDWKEEVEKLVQKWHNNSNKEIK